MINLTHIVLNNKDLIVCDRLAVLRSEAKVDSSRSRGAFRKDDGNMPGAFYFVAGIDMAASGMG